MLLTQLLRVSIGTITSSQREERKMPVRTMIKEGGCDVGTKYITWVKVNSDYKILFRLMDGLQSEGGCRYWIKEHSAEGDIVVIGEELEQKETEVKIAFPVTRYMLISSEQYVK